MTQRSGNWILGAVAAVGLATLPMMFAVSPAQAQTAGHEDCKRVINMSWDELLKDLRSCDKLKNNLADFYFKSDRNGMPWGRWDPKYQSVGVVKTKSV